MPETLKNNVGTTVAFGEVVQLSKASSKNPKADGFERYVWLEHLEPNDLRIRRWGDIADGTTFTNVFKPGQVLLGKRRAYQRKVAVADFSGVCSGDIYVLSSKGDDLLPELLPFICQSEPFYDYVISMSQGGLSPRVNWKALVQYEFTLPPLEEQRRIAEMLQAAVAACAALASARTAGTGAYEANCKRLFIEERDRLATSTVGDVADVRNGTTPRRSRGDYWGKDVPWLPAGKVNERRVKTADEFITQKALDECSLGVIPAGSILVAMVGQGATRGRAALLEIDATINQNLAAVTPREGILPSFLYYQLDALYEALRNWSHGSNQKALNCRLVRDFRIWVPSDARQREISECLDQIDKAQKSLADRVLSARALTRRVLGICLEGATS